MVTKIPRFAFEKFPQAYPTLNTQMKSVGEAMAIGCAFKEGEHTRLACRFRRPRRNHLPPPPDSVSGALADAREGACAPHCSLEPGRPPTSRSGRGGDGKPGRSGTEVYGDRDILPRDGLGALRCLWRRR